MEKPVSEFHSRGEPKQKHKLRYNCKDCHKHVSKKKYHQDYKSKITQEDRYGWWLKWKYGVSAKDYQKMYDKQNGQCAICKQPGLNSLFDKKGLNLDHCHKTTLPRGLLCHACNTGLGRFRDSIEFLKNAIKYLRKNSSN